MEKNRYRKINTVSQSTWIIGAPIEIDKGLLLIDAETDQIILQLSLRNVSSMTINEAEIEIIGILPDQYPSGFPRSRYVYSGLSCTPGNSFGNAKAVLLGTDPIQQVQVIIREVRFSDGSVWLNRELEQDEALSVVDFTEKAVLGQTTKVDRVQMLSPQTPVSQIAGVPSISKDHWLCSCGFPNPPLEPQCGRCGIRKEWVIENGKSDILAQKPSAGKRFRTRDVELREAKKMATIKKWKKRIPFGIAGILLISLGTFLYIENGRKAEFYVKSIQLFKTGQFAYAETAFRQLGGYKDSEDWLSQSVAEPRYLVAMKFFEEKNYDQAAIEFQALDEYKDATELMSQSLNESKYIKATALYESKDYAKAVSEFETLGNYKDSPEMIDQSKKQPLYEKAISLLESRQFAEAEKVFIELGEYKDSPEKLKKALLAVSAPREFEDALTLAMGGKADQSLKELASLYPFDNKELNENWFLEYGKALYQQDYFLEALPYFEHIQDQVDVSEFLETIPYKVIGKWRYGKMDIVFRLKEKGAIWAQSILGESPFGDLTHQWDPGTRNSFATKYERWTITNLKGQLLTMTKQYVGSDGKIVEETFEMTFLDEMKN